MRHAAVRVSFRKLLVKRDQWDTSWGAKKIIFLIRDIDDAANGGRVDGILSIRGPEVSRSSLGVGSRHVQSPTPYARALPSVHTYKQGPLRFLARARAVGSGSVDCG